MIHWSTVITALLLFASFASANDAAAPKVEPAFVDIHRIRELSSNLADLSHSQRNSAPTGTTVGLLISVPGKHIVGIDWNAANKASITDNNGTVLGESSFNQADPWSPRAVRISTPSVPAIGATKVKIKGNVVLKCATGEKTEEFKDVSLFTLREIQLPNSPFVIRQDEPTPTPTKYVEGPPGPRHQQLVTFLIYSTDYTKILKNPEMFVPKKSSLVPKSSDELWPSASRLPAGLVRCEGGMALGWAFSSYAAIPREFCTLQVTYFDNIVSVTVPVDGGGFGTLNEPSPRYYCENTHENNISPNR